MASPITKIEQDILNSTLRSLGEAGGTTEHTDWMRGRGNADLLIRFIDQQRWMFEKNPYKMSVEEQLIALRCANDEEKWAITEEDFARLATMAPAWPQGKYAYRSFRIRFGEGSEGVQLTFERHVARIKSVFGERSFVRWSHLKSGKSCLRLRNGNHTHKPVIEWVTVDLRTRHRRDSRSPADELLVVVWLFADMIRDIDYDRILGLSAAGYEINLPRFDSETWESVVIVGFSRDDRKVSVSAKDHSDDDSFYSLSRLRE